MYNVLAIGDADFCAGFALAGIATQCVAADGLSAALARARAGGQVGIVIVDEAQAAALPGPEVGGAARLPVVVPVPAEMRWRDLEQHDEDTYVAALIRRAIGYPLDIQL